MLFAIDIDGTIATGFKLKVNFYNRELGLHIPESISDYPSLLSLPEVMAYRQKHEDRFQAAWRKLGVSTEVMLARDQMPNAVAGITILSQRGRVRYYTVRKSPDKQRHQEIQETTQQWLSMNHFPNHFDIIFCKSLMHKLSRIYQQERATQESIVLIDDRYCDLILAFEKIAAGECGHVADFLRERLTLVAFGSQADTLPITDSGLHVLALSSWESVIDLLVSTNCVNNSVFV